MNLSSSGTSFTTSGFQAIIKLIYFFVSPISTFQRPFSLHSFLDLLCYFLYQFQNDLMLFHRHTLSSICLLLCTVDSGEELTSLGQLSFSWYYAFGLHFCEPQAYLPRMASTRILVFFLWAYCMTLTIVYSGNLTAFLLVRKPAASIETIEDLYRSGLQVAALGRLFLDGIMHATDPNLRVSLQPWPPKPWCSVSLQATFIQVCFK